MNPPESDVKRLIISDIFGSDVTSENELKDSTYLKLFEIQALAHDLSIVHYTNFYNR